MLIYHPAFDAYHCLVRFCAILEGGRTLEFDRLRILDFYLCFPAALTEFKLPKQLTALRTRARQVENPYRVPIGAKRVFSDLEMIHQACVGCLVAAQVVESVDGPGNVQRTNMPLPEDLIARCNRLREEEVFFFSEILPAGIDMALGGVDGLKARSGLVEYRYDAA